MSFLKLLFFNSFLVSLFIINCSNTNQSTQENNENSLSYAEEVKEVKTTCNSYTEFESRMNVIQKKYGFSSLDNEDLLIDESYSDNSGKVIESKDAKETLNKVASGILNSNNYLVTKWGEYDVEQVYCNDLTITSNSTLEVSMEKNSNASVDPFMVLYYVNNGNPGEDPSLQQEIKVLDFNDDYNGLYPRIYWKNNTGATKVVYVLVFAYSNYGKGTAQINIIKEDITRNYSINVAGKVFFGDMGYLNRRGASITKPEEWVSSENFAVSTSSSYEDYYRDMLPLGDYLPRVKDNANTYLWAFNLKDKIGLANDFIGQEGKSSGSLIARYAENDIALNKDFTFPNSSWHYPSFVLLGGNVSGGKASIIQIRQFD